MTVEFDVDSPHGCMVVGMGGARYACVVTFEDGEQLFDFYGRVPSNGRVVAAAPDGRRAFRVEDVRRAIDDGGLAEPIDLPACSPWEVLTVADAMLDEADFRARIGALFDGGVVVDYGEALSDRGSWKFRLKSATSEIDDNRAIIAAVAKRLSSHHWEREAESGLEVFLESYGLGDDFRDFLTLKLKHAK